MKKIRTVATGAIIAISIILGSLTIAIPMNKIANKADSTYDLYFYKAIVHYGKTENGAYMTYETKWIKSDKYFTEKDEVRLDINDDVTLQDGTVWYVSNIEVNRSKIGMHN